MICDSSNAASVSYNVFVAHFVPFPPLTQPLNKNTKLFCNTENLFYCTDCFFLVIMMMIFFSLLAWPFCLVFWSWGCSSHNRIDIYNRSCRRKLTRWKSRSFWNGSATKAPGKLGLSVLINIFHCIYHKSLLTKTGTSGTREAIYYWLHSALIDVERLKTLGGGLAQQNVCGVGNIFTGGVPTSKSWHLMPSPPPLLKCKYTKHSPCPQGFCRSILAGNGRIWTFVFVTCKWGDK